MNIGEQLGTFIDESPTPFHVVVNVRDKLLAEGFVELAEASAWPETAGSYVVVRDGSLIAWRVSDRQAPQHGFRIIGAHTDSPNLRVKQHHDLTSDGLSVVALEPYGGPLLDTWLDRDLKIAGRILEADGTQHLVHIAEPSLRVPHLAIHLDRDNSGAKPDRQRHLNAVWSTGGGRFLDWVSHETGVAEQIVGFDLMTADVTRSVLYGAHHEFLAAPRLDNLASCFAALEALIDAPNREDVISMIVLFDHEEVGSMSERGAQSDFLLTTIERVGGLLGGTREDLFRSIANSVCLSADMAHATHPNYPEKHEPLHRIAMGAGPVLKVHQNLRYATDGKGAAIVARACQDAGVNLQRYVHRADLAAGSTIGPISSARTGILTIDIGAPQLAMHSIRETMAVSDIDPYIKLMSAFIDPHGTI